MEERRRFKRYDCYFIVHKRKNHPEEDDFFGEVHNMSGGGAMIECEHEVQRGQILSLAFIMNDRDQVWEGRGKVVWVVGKGARFRFGLEFTTRLEENWHERVISQRGIKKCS